MRRRSKRPFVLALCTVMVLSVAALVTAGCGEAITTTTAEASQTTGTTGGTTGGTTADPIAELTAKINAATAVPEFQAPGDPIDVKSLQGKKVFSVPLDSTNPFLAAIEGSMEEIAKLAGIEFTTFTNQAQPTQWVQGIEQAIAQKVDVIILGSVVPSQVAPQVAKAKAAGIPVISGHALDPSDPLPDGISGNAAAPFHEAARLEADWVIVDAANAGVNANVVVLQAADTIPAAGMVAAIQDEFAKYYGDKSKLTVINIPIPNWSKDIQTQVQSALTKDPTVNYIIPIYDPMCVYAVPGVKAVGMEDKVKISTFNGTPAIVKMLQAGDVVSMDLTEDSGWIAAATLDVAFRLMLDVPPNIESAPLRVLDASNAKDAGDPPAYGRAMGTAFLDEYLTLWGLK